MTVSISGVMATGVMTSRGVATSGQACRGIEEVIGLGLMMALATHQKDWKSPSGVSSQIESTNVGGSAMVKSSKGAKSPKSPKSPKAGSKGSKGSWFSRKSKEEKKQQGFVKANQALPKDTLNEKRASTTSTIASSSTAGDGRRNGSSADSVVSALSNDSTSRSRGSRRSKK